MRIEFSFFIILPIFSLFWDITNGKSLEESSDISEGSIISSTDEEIEDLRSELLAYDALLKSLSSRKSLVSTPCWHYGGICIDQKLCAGTNNFLTQIPGCRGKLYVCCFVNNKYYVKDMTEFGINSIGLPWSIQKKYGGKGIIGNNDEKESSSEKTIGEINFGEEVEDNKKHSDEVIEHFPEATEAQAEIDYEQETNEAIKLTHVTGVYTIPFITI